MLMMLLMMIMMMVMIIINSDTSNVTEATGIISKSLRKYLSNIAGKQNQGSTDNNRNGHRTHTLESANVRVQNIQHGTLNYVYHIL